MSVPDTLEKIESMIASGRVPGTSRSLVNIERLTALLEEIKGDMPEHSNEAMGVVRQKDAILKQAELEARRLRAYADEEATTIRQLAEEQSTAALTSSRQQAETMIQGSEVVKNANERAAQIVREAEVKAQHILAEAKNKLNGILSEAEKQADDRRKGADAYAREVLFTLEEKVADVLGQLRAGIDMLDHNKTAAAA